MMRIGLISRIALLVVCIEVAAFSVLGWFYTDRFSSAAEDRIRSRLHLLGQMIGRDELPISAIALRPLVSDLVGAPCLEGIVVGGSGRVIVSSDPSYLGRPADGIPGFDPRWIADGGDEQLSGRGETLTSVAQINAGSGGAAIYRTIITISTAELKAQQRSIAWRGRLFSAMFILLSSGGITFLAQRLITRRVATSLKILKKVENGALGARIPVGSDDELGQLQRGINSMTAKLGALLTEHRRNEEEISAILDAITDGVVAVGADGDILRCNPSAAGILGRPQDACTGVHLSDLLPELSWRDGKVCGPESMTPSGRIHLQRRTPDAGPRSIEMGWGPIKGPDGATVGAVLALQDVTARRKAEEELHEAVERLTVSNAELERFAYVASHDLQEPLRSIVSFTQLLERRIGADLAAQDRECFGFVVAAAKRMSLLINDLLAYSRVTADRRFARVSLRDACGSATNNLREAIGESGAEVTIDDLPEVIGDGVQLMQVFQNLVGNALKFRRPQVQPHVHVFAERGNGEWIISVADNGIGIADTDQDIFEIFRRLHPAGSFPGSGVGLAICKRIVQLHQGRIWWESRPGEGTTFHFELPDMPLPTSQAA